MTFFSDLDDTEQPYGLYIPKNYDPTKKYPLVIMLHGAGSNHRLSLRRVFGKSNANDENDVEATRYFPEWKDVDYIVASPYARGTAGYQGIAEKDVMDVLADVKKKFNIDEDRTYLTGLSMGGGGTLWIGLTRPDLWAAIAPVCPAPPRGTDDLAPNSFNLPVYFQHGDADPVVPVTISREWVKRMKAIGTQVEYSEYPGVQHDSWVNAYEGGRIFSWFDKFKRNPFPKTVKYATHQYVYDRAYWVQLDHIQPGTTAYIEASIKENNTIEVITRNTEAFTLNLANHPAYDSRRAVQVTIDGKKVKTSPGESLEFSLQNSKWTNQKRIAPPLVKRKHSEGPISMAFSNRHVYVYGTKDNPSAEELKTRADIAQQAANWSVFRNSFLGRIMFFPRVVPDKELRPSDRESSNLILFGTKETNEAIAAIADQLPIHLKTSASDVGLMYIYPVKERYVVINSGLPWSKTNQGNEFSFIPAPYATLSTFKDFILFKEHNKNIIHEGFFNTQWKLSAEQRKLMEVYVE